MSKFCEVCRVEHPLDQFGMLYENSSRRPEPAPYCLEMAQLEAYQRYRIKKRNIDEAAFLRRNANLMKSYRTSHPEIDEEYNRKRRMEPSHRMRNCVVNHARSKGIFLSEEDIPAMETKLSQPCRYCGYLELSVTLNGLDRVDPNLGYTDANTVPSCDTCNYMKHTFNVDLFLSKIEAIVQHGELKSDTLPAKALSFFGKAKAKIGPKRSYAVKDDLLTEEQKKLLSLQCCDYCGEREKVGLDRVDSEKPYEVQNVVPCCTMCNYMKKDLSPDDFRKHCLRISMYNKS